MTQSMSSVDQARGRTRGTRSHHPDDREGATLLLIVLIAVALTLLTTPTAAGLVTILAVTAMVA